MRAASATGAALRRITLPRPAAIVRARVADRGEVHVHRQARTRIVWQCRYVSAALILIGHPITREMILEAIDVAAAAHFTLIVLVAIATRSQAIAHHRSDYCAGGRGGHATVAASNLRSQQTACDAADDGACERAATITLALRHVLGIAFLARHVDTLILRRDLRDAGIVVVARPGEGSGCSHDGQHGGGNGGLAHDPLLKVL